MLQQYRITCVWCSKVNRGGFSRCFGHQPVNCQYCGQRMDGEDGMMVEMEKKRAEREREARMEKNDMIAKMRSNE